LHRRTHRTLSGITAVLFIAILPLIGLSTAAAQTTEEPAAPAAAATAQADNTETESTPQQPPAEKPATLDKTDSTAPAEAQAVTTPSPPPDATTVQEPVATQPAGGTAQTATLRNNTDSTSVSGNATLKENDDVGDARSGEATAEATHVNVVNSTLGSGATDGVPLLQNVYVRNIYNDAGADSVQGNILIDPASLVPVGGEAGDTGLVQSELVQHGSSLVGIENNINLEAVSGNATLSNNDDTGSAISGDATALANIINIVNTSVGAERSFVGVINIFGDLHGDIQVPRSFVDSLLADTPAPAAADGESDGEGEGPYGPVSTDINIANNVDLDAVSGNALIAGNDSAGDARSGDATTQLNVYNLTGQEVVARNSLLVFINVMGRWVGMIMNAPGGESTSTALVGGAESGDMNPTASASTNDIAPGGADSAVNIRNNVRASARSGDAAVTGNDDAGDATSGNARAGANILNLVHSSFNLGDWFGALFINVLGSWLGSFGILDDEAPAPAGNDSGGLPAGGAVQAVRVFRLGQDTRFNAKPQKPAPAAEGTVESAATEQPATTDTTDTAAAVRHDSGSDDSSGAAQPARRITGLPFLAAAAIISLITVLTIIARHRLSREYYSLQ
jgi:hypothetical protein